MPLELTKLDAARRQIEAAIRMTFAGEDPAAIHSVAAAARGIIKNLCEISGQVESFDRFTDWIAPGHEGDFWSALNSSGNFLKHADKDPNAVLSLDEDETDIVILMAAKWYRDLTRAQSIEMTMFVFWFSIKNPELVNPELGLALEGTGYRQIMDEIARLNARPDRSDYLKMGRALLDKQHPAPPHKASEIHG